MRKFCMGLFSVLLMGGLALSFVSCGSKKSSPTSPSGPTGTPVLYVYGSNTTAATNYQNLLNANGYNCTTATLANATNDSLATLSNYSVILIGDDAEPITALANTTLATNIYNSGKPVIGIGLGGSYFFNEIGITAIGYSSIAYFSGTDVSATNTSDVLWSSPNVIAPTTSAVLYGTTSSYYAPYYTGTPPAGTVLLADDPSYAGAYPLASFFTGTTTYFTWGYQSDPSSMTPNGKNLFINLLNKAKAEPKTLVSYPETTGGGSFITDGMDIVSYPGTSLASVVLWISSDTAGTYTFNLTAFEGCYGGTNLGTATSGSVVLTSNTTSNVPVTFTYAVNPAVTKGDAVDFLLAQNSGPSATDYFSISGNFGSLTAATSGVNDLSATSGCSPTIHNDGYAVLVAGNP